MKILILGLCIFFLSLLAHFIIWKVQTPKFHTKSLLAVFFLTAFASLAFLKLPTIVNPLVRYAPGTPAEYIHIFLLFISLSLAYITTYSAVEVDSPSIVMVSKIKQAGPLGLDEAKLKEFMNDGILITPRINDLVRDKLAVIKDGRYKLTKTGEVFVNVFIFYRKLLDKPKGG